MRECFFTSIALNYLPRALALASSVFAVYPRSRFVMSVLDLQTLSPAGRAQIGDLLMSFADKGLDLEVIDPTKLYAAGGDLRYRYAVIEACTLVKPAVALHLLETSRTVTYLDPDTVLYQPLPQDARSGDDWDFQVTPHILGPSSSSALVSERLFLFKGTFNLGYFAVRGTPQAVAFLRWWKQFCIDFGAMAPETGLYVDQRPVDLLTSFVDKVSVLRHPGCNVAWWNIYCDQRKVEADAAHVFYGGRQHSLTFFHFSNLDDGEYSRRLVARSLHGCAEHRQASSLLCDDVGLAALYQDYYARLESWRKCSARLSATGIAPGSASKHPSSLARLLFCEAQRRGQVYRGDPFEDGNLKVIAKSAAYALSRLTLRDVQAIRMAFRAFRRNAMRPTVLRHLT